MNWFVGHNSNICLVKGESVVGRVSQANIGSVTLTSENPSIATVSVNGNEIILTGVNEGNTIINSNLDEGFYIYVMNKPQIIFESNSINLYDYINKGYSGETEYGCDYILGLFPIGYYVDIISAPDDGVIINDLSLPKTYFHNPQYSQSSWLANKATASLPYNFAVSVTRHYYDTADHKETVVVGLYNNFTNQLVKSYSLKIRADLTYNR